MGQKALPIAHIWVVFDRGEYTDVCAINSPDTVMEEVETWVISDHGGNGGILRWEFDLRSVEWGAGEKKQDPFKISYKALENTNRIYTYLNAYFLIVAGEC